jgi:hypothetical protein
MEKKMGFKDLTTTLKVIIFCSAGWTILFGAYIFIIFLFALFVGYQDLSAARLN